MATAPRFFRQADLDIVERAKKKLKRDPDTNALVDAKLIEEVENLMPFDVQVERRKKAERLVRDAERPHKTQADGSLWLPGFEPHPYEPQQLIPDGKGLTVERDLATPHFLSASLQRKATNLQRAEKAYARDLGLHDPFVEWAADQALNGRPPNEITCGNFVREKGFWRQDAVEGEPEE